MLTYKEGIPALSLNQCLAMEEFILSSEAPFTDDEMTVLADKGLNPVKISVAYISYVDPLPSVNFIRDIKSRIEKDRPLSLRQARAVLNIWRDKLLGLKPSERLESDYENNRTGYYKCRECGAVDDNIGAHIDHKVNAHDYEIPFGSYEQAVVAPVSVIDRPEETGFDFTELPDGNYAIPDATSVGGGGFRFLKVRRLPKPTHFNRKFTYGVRLTGSEILPAGTVTVREWSSDRKELSGVQRPDQSYAGKFTAQLTYAMENSQAASILFAVMKTRCAICNKSLTTPESRAAYIGPDCEEQHGSLTEYIQTWGELRLRKQAEYALAGTPVN